MSTPSHPDFICCLKGETSSNPVQLQLQYIHLKTFGRARRAHAKIMCFCCSLLLRNQGISCKPLANREECQACMVQILLEVLIRQSRHPVPWPLESNQFSVYSCTSLSSLRLIEEECFQKMYDTSNNLTNTNHVHLVRPKLLS